MAHLLDVSVPLLDHRLVEWISTLPFAFRRYEYEDEYLRRNAEGPVLPHDILYRPDRGFAVSLGDGFRGPWCAGVEPASACEVFAGASLFGRRCATACSYNTTADNGTGARHEDEFRCAGPSGVSSRARRRARVQAGIGLTTATCRSCRPPAASVRDTIGSPRAWRCSRACISSSPIGLLMK